VFTTESAEAAESAEGNGATGSGDPLEARRLRVTTGRR